MSNDAERGNNMLLYNADDMKMFIDSNCEEIISFVIGPIHKEYYEILCYSENEEFRLLYSKNNIEKMIEFAKNYCSNKTTFEEFQTKICKLPGVVAAYKNKFMIEADISNLQEQLLLIKNFKSNGIHVKNCRVLDGFSMKCKLFATNEGFHIKDFSRSKEYQAIVDLANRILDFIRVDSDHRFVIVDEC